MRGTPRDVVRFRVRVWLDRTKAAKPILEREVACVLPREVAREWPSVVDLVKKEESDEG